MATLTERLDERGRPELPIKRRPLYYQINLRIPPDLADQIDNALSRLNRTRSDDERISRAALLLAAIRDAIETVDRRAAEREMEAADSA
jgi:hypothetical protein